MARTSLERMSERSSNDTIASFLDDADGCNVSGEWHAHAMRDFRAELKLDLGEPSSPLPPATAAGRRAKADGWGVRKAAAQTHHAAPPQPPPPASHHRTSVE